MKKIKHIAEQIEEELHSAEDYAKCAMRLPDSDQELATVYKQLAETELGHVGKLHAQVVRIIKAYKATGNETPAAMQAVWDWEHEKMIDHEARIKAMLK